MSKNAFNGFKQSSVDPQKAINPSNGHWIKVNDGGSITVSTSRHNTYAAGTSQNFLAERLKK